jgi:glycosidase
MEPMVDYRHEMLHDSAMEDFRTPVGALKAGEPVTIRLRVRAAGVKVVCLKLFDEHFSRLYKLRPNGNGWEAELAAPDTPGVYWYYFCINIDNKIYYYGTDGKKTSGTGSVYTDPPPAYQMTVYGADFATPDWLKKSVMYQIFPDRFRRSPATDANKGVAYHKSRGRKAFLHEKWEEAPLYLPLKGEEHYTPCDYFGGNLKGIEESLGYLKKLGVGVVYLNPVFEAASNHRYNTADYLKIDPVLGTEADLVSLAKKAASMGIRILLDGVFSHTGSDSVYFNREGAYPGPGAYNSPESPYYSWYRFESYPDKYKSWWNFKTLPEVNERDESYQQFMFRGEDSVLKHWMKAGASGYRLDVADELPDDVLHLMYETVKEADKEAAMIGEIWEDATTKYSYGEKRRYALGGELDSVTNYPLRNAIVDFLTGKKDAYELKDFLVGQAVNYPPPMYYCLMNLLSSHDIERIRNALGARIDPHELTREQQALFALSESQNERGARLQRLAAAIVYSLPGVPCIYYGDETGMQGLLDPFNRKPFYRGKIDLTEYYIQLGAIRNASDALNTGRAVFFAEGPDCAGILRYIAGGRDAFGQTAQDGVYFTAVNRSEAIRRVVFDLAGRNPLMPEQDKKTLRQRANGRAKCLLTGAELTIDDGLVEAELKPMSAVILRMSF